MPSAVSPAIKFTLERRREWQRRDSQLARDAGIDHIGQAATRDAGNDPSAATDDSLQTADDDTVADNSDFDDNLDDSDFGDAGDDGGSYDA